MKAQEIITTDRETGCCDDCSERILKALRDAAGASATDSITIAADGTVGRLECYGRTADGEWVFRRATKP